MEQVRIIVHGRVQGVFFRANAQKEAVRLGLSGWVRNTEAGAVEAVAVGSRAALEAFVEWCKRGPSGARVDKTDVSWEECLQMGAGFHIRLG